MTTRRSKVWIADGELCPFSFEEYVNVRCETLMHDADWLTCAGYVCSCDATRRETKMKYDRNMT